MKFNFNYHAPKSQKEFLELLSKEKDAKILAGGTDLIVNMRSGLTKPKTIIDFKKIKEYKSLEFSEDNGLVIGAAITINELLQSKIVKKKFPILASASHKIASHQLRNRATVVGNIVNASPSADLSPALLCLKAQIKLVSSQGQRVVDLEDFFVGVKKTIIKKNEFAKEIIVPAQNANMRGKYKKLTRIKGHDLSLLGVAITKNDKCIRVAINAAAPKALLIGEFSTSGGEKEILKAISTKISPIDDIRCSKEYREFMAKNYALEILKELS